MQQPFSLLCFVMSLTIAPDFPSQLLAQEQNPKLAEAELGDTFNVHSFGNTLLAGQPSVDDLKLARRQGVKTVITLRTAGEIDWDEEDVVKGLDMEFHSIPFRGAGGLTDEVFAQSLKLLTDVGGDGLLLHCASANRVGAIWLAHRVLNDRLDVNAAKNEAKTVGLRNEGYEKRALEYIKKQQSQ